MNWMGSFVSIKHKFVIEIYRFVLQSTHATPRHNGIKIYRYVLEAAKEAFGVNPKSIQVYYRRLRKQPQYLQSHDTNKLNLLFSDVAFIRIVRWKGIVKTVKGVNMKCLILTLSFPFVSLDI